MSGLEFDDEMRAKIKGHLPLQQTREEKRLAAKLSSEQFSFDEEHRRYALIDAIGKPLNKIFGNSETQKALSCSSPLKFGFDKMYERITSGEYSSTCVPSRKSYAILQLEKKLAVAFDCDLDGGKAKNFTAIPLKPDYRGWGVVQKVWVADDSAKIMHFENQNDLHAYIKPMLAKSIADNISTYTDRKIIRFSKLGAFALAAGLLYSCASDAAELPEHSNFDTNPDTHLVIEP